MDEKVFSLEENGDQPQNTKVSPAITLQPPGKKASSNQQTTHNLEQLQKTLGVPRQKDTEGLEKLFLVQSKAID